MILWGQDGTAIWDSETTPTTAIFGEPGVGKTTLARHAIRSWLRSNGTVVVGANMPGEYENLSHLIHLTSPDEAVQYGQIADVAATPEDNLLIVLDETFFVSIDGYEYLYTREDSHVSWLVLGRAPFAPERMPSIGVGQLASRCYFHAFGTETPLPNMLDWGSGHSLRKYDGGFVESWVPPEAQQGLMEDSVVNKKPLPRFARRRFYALRDGSPTGTLAP